MALVKLQAKYIQSLSQKKFRDEEGTFVAEGPKIINELLNSENVELLHLFATRNWTDKNTQLHKTSITEIKETELERISFLQTSNQVLGIFKKPVFKKPHYEGEVTLMLDGIQDPGNLGTMVRTADWFGIHQIICCKDSADVFNPKAVQSTMGSIARVRVIPEDLKSFIEAHSSIPVYATALKGKNIFEMDAIKEGFILIGNESKGIQEELLALAPKKITIPKSGNAESLNAAVAAGIIMAWVKART
jgi:TrmH family RNA methyltransferase